MPALESRSCAESQPRYFIPRAAAAWSESSQSVRPRASACITSGEFAETARTFLLPGGGEQQCGDRFRGQPL